MNVATLAINPDHDILWKTKTSDLSPSRDDQNQTTATAIQQATA
jgi:hypothetical protein